MSTRDRLAGETKQGAKFGWQISIIKPMFTNNVASYKTSLEINNQSSYNVPYNAKTIYDELQT
jgi:hypothetical protein